MPVLPSYRNQLIDLHSKSIDWFLYERKLAFHVLNGCVLTINCNVLFVSRGYTRFGRFTLPGFTRRLIYPVHSKNFPKN